LAAVRRRAWPLPFLRLLWRGQRSLNIDARADIRDADAGRFALVWLVEASVGRHSEKPSDFCEIIEIYFPTLPKVDLHARSVIPGSDAFADVEA
jgi:N6-adenosine-specific RNA methylase IME4